MEKPNVLFARLDAQGRADLGQRLNISPPPSQWNDIPKNLRNRAFHILGGGNGVDRKGHILEQHERDPQRYRTTGLKNGV